MPLLTRKRLIQCKIESSYGTDPTPDGGDALLVRSLEVNPIEADVISRDLIRPYLGTSEQILAQQRVSLSFQVELAGSGAAATAPRFDSLLRACGMAATTTASAITGTSTGGASNSITLAAAASAVDGAYVGMIITITSGTGNGSSGIITAYNGTTKVATVQPISATFSPATSATYSGYSIAANVGYKPVSSGFESVTIYFNNDGVLHKATGCRGTFSLSGEVNQLPVLDFQFTGIYNAPSDTAQDTAAYTNQATPVVFKSDNTKAYSLMGYSGCLMSLSLDMANVTTYRELVGCTKQVLITNRTPTGQAMIEAPTIAAKDYFAIANNDTTGVLSAVHGQTAGNRVGIVAPKVDIANPSYSDSDGIQMLTLPLSLLPSSVGNDELTLTFG